MVDPGIIGIIQSYLAVLPQYGIHPTAAVLYGSFARGDNTQDSDIDILVLAPEFDHLKDRSAIDSMWRAAKVDYRLEPIACGSSEWRTDEARPIVEIARREGLVIPV